MISHDKIALESYTQEMFTDTVIKPLQIRCRSTFRIPRNFSCFSTVPGQISANILLSNPLSFEVFDGAFWMSPLQMSRSHTGVY